MQNIDKLLDLLSIHAEVQHKFIAEQDAINAEIRQLRSDAQDLRTDLLQLRAEFQQLHNDLSKICMILATPKANRMEFAVSIFGDEFERMKESENNAQPNPNNAT
ncbi:MAG: hypothetical protein NZM06_01325 [Chloroherpetonaceae bacterium]|nr:hypothetical protein [Chloroherpetonaceae bacterium]MDW8436695.1 hypothetical protein [Chloroherpetonaceae bacterium]